ncbi:hypothetical protein QE152_g4761 [Popillia japonica]|uniref:Uncharacterized protein n=1 Tax=Popillia japonica TaxID=7064 RepID=A0AAW1MZZ9_POPJA
MDCRNTSEETKGEIVGLWKAGLTTRDIAEHVNKSQQTLPGITSTFLYNFDATLRTDFRVIAAAEGAEVGNFDATLRTDFRVIAAAEGAEVGVDSSQ